MFPCCFNSFRYFVTLSKLATLRTSLVQQSLYLRLADGGAVGQRVLGFCELSALLLQLPYATTLFRQLLSLSGQLLLQVLLLCLKDEPRGGVLPLRFLGLCEPVLQLSLHLPQSDEFFLGRGQRLTGRRELGLAR